mmetsp:Transcript_10654/g.11976  ORF Transcript_10654/g.11976 Transcript_10654/m.11976 type:complete len:130 (+) Transcript_10654:688-1077(+)
MIFHYNLATKAFNSGDKKAAKREAEEGARYKHLYLSEKREAVNKTLRLKNKDLNLNEKIDLHGLHKNEVRAALDFFISSIKRKIKAGEIVPNSGLGKGHNVKVITGKGNNSKNSIPVIKEEVQAYFRQH